MRRLGACRRGTFESLSLSLLELQLDNQTMHPAFPVVLGPMRQSDPWLAASKGAVVRVHQQRNLTLPDLDYFTDLDVELEPLALCLEETLLRDVLKFCEGAGRASPFGSGARPWWRPPPKVALPPSRLPTAEGVACLVAPETSPR